MTIGLEYILVKLIQTLRNNTHDQKGIKPNLRFFDRYC